MQINKNFYFLKRAQYIKILIIILSGFFCIFFVSGCSKQKETQIHEEKTGNFFVGWASEDITPENPVLLQGQFPARISEGVRDPVTVTALAIESKSGSSSEKIILISCDLVVISDGIRSGYTDNLRDISRKLIKEDIPEIMPEQIILNATHTHTAPYCSAEDAKSVYGIELDAMSPADCQMFTAQRIALAAKRAWENRKPGGVSFGLGHAVASHNRLWSHFNGETTKRGNTNSKDFSHIEGYEDHSVNLLYTWDNENRLNGVVINVASPSQALGHDHMISADYWHDVRIELHKRLGDNIFILPQCSPAGDQAPHILVGLKAEERMQRIMFPDVDGTGNDCMGRRKQVALRIAEAVTSVLPYMKDHIERDPVIKHKMEEVNLSRRLVSIDDVNNGMAEAEKWQKQFDKLITEINENPAVKQKPGWYKNITSAYRFKMRGESVRERYELQKTHPKLPVEIHVIRIGDVVIATNPFELYLDYGIRIKAQSPAVQTFLVQLAGSGTYLPTMRSVEGGAYGAVPASTLVGPEGGRELVEKTLELIHSIWE